MVGGARSITLYDACTPSSVLGRVNTARSHTLHCMWTRLVGKVDQCAGGEYPGTYPSHVQNLYGIYVQVEDYKMLYTF